MDERVHFPQFLRSHEFHGRLAVPTSSVLKAGCSSDSARAQLSSYVLQYVSDLFRTYSTGCNTIDYIVPRNQIPGASELFHTVNEHVDPLLKQIMR